MKAVLLLLFLGLAPCRAEMFSDVQFRADFYQRDLQNNTLKGKGNAWLKRGEKQVWADELEVDLSTKRAVARGHVHIREEPIDIWARMVSYNLDGEDAILEEATLISGSMVLTGAVVKRLDLKRYEIDEGSYTNCNTELRRDEGLHTCEFDWKVVGRFFSINMGSYAHINDAIVFVKDLPSFYVPYVVFPVKTERQSGFLIPQFGFSDNLGTAVTLPYFLTLGGWQDITLLPTFHSKTGYHLGIDYRYAWSKETAGEARFFLLQRRFSQDRANPAPDDPNRERTLGFIGEYSLDVNNRIQLTPRAYSLQQIKYVSDPYYTTDYKPDVGLGYDQPSLRSQIAFVFPSDSTLLLGQMQHYQNLIIPKDTGIDRGTVTLLPQVSFSKINTSLFDQLFSYEVDTTLTNYHRAGAEYDPVPASLNRLDTIHVDPNPAFHTGDYLRVGRRFTLEPRLMMNVPMPQGLQFQPQMRAGSLVYHFTTPESNLFHREYLQFELPVSVFLNKQFTIPLEGYEKVSHVFQPRFIYAKSAYQSGTGSHPFFYRDVATGLSNPKFDLLDQLTDFEYMRFELINRFLRKTPSGSNRFFLLQLSEQYNVRTSDEDPRFAKRVGPIELLSEFSFWRFVGQVQGNYQLETTLRAPGDEVRENDISSSLSYVSGFGDRLTIGNRIRISVDDNLTEKTVLLSFYKSLPTFFDLDGNAEYSYKRGDLMGARLGLIFASKPRSCWGLQLNFGQDDLKRKYLRLIFRLDFGGGYSASFGL